MSMNQHNLHNSHGEKNETTGAGAVAARETWTTDHSSATRVVAIDLNRLASPTAAPAGSAAGPNAAAAPAEPDPERKSAHRMAREEMLAAFRALREARLEQGEDELVIDAIVDDERPSSLREAIRRV